MNRLNNISRRSVSALFAVLALIIVFSAAARAQSITPQVTCVAPDPADAQSYIAYFGYTNTGSNTVYIPSGSVLNYFFPESSPDDAPYYFYPGVHRKAVGVSVPRTRNETWIINGVLATASFQPGLACGGNITYQGRLSAANAAANGQYDLRFQVFDALTGGTAQSDAQTIAATVTNGVFTVALDADALGIPRTQTGQLSTYLEISVRQGTAAFTVLAPRQPITATPFAVNAITANSAANVTLDGNLLRANTVSDNNNGLLYSPTLDGLEMRGKSGFVWKTGSFDFSNSGTERMRLDAAGNLTVGGTLTVSGTINGTVANANNSAQLGGVAANQYLTTASAGTNFIQNTTTQQATSNFNISGNGTLGGTLTANTITANSTINQLLNANSSSPIGTWLTLNNTTTGGRKWSIISTGASNGEGAGKLLLYDETNNIGRLLLSDAGANITGDLTVTGAINGTVSNATNATNATNVSGGFVQLPLTTGAPPSSECNAASQYGRQKVDAGNVRLYICTASGWKSTVLQ